MVLVNILGDVCEDGYAARNMLERNDLQLWISVCVCLVWFTVIRFYFYVVEMPTFHILLSLNTKSGYGYIPKKLQTVLKDVFYV